MKANIQQLSPNDISSDVFIVAPSQVDTIAKKFGTEMAVAMNVRPLAYKIQQIANEVLLQILRDARKMGE